MTDGTVRGTIRQTGARAGMIPAGARIGALLLGIACTAPGFAADSVDHGARPSGNVQVIGRFAQAEPSGIVALPDGRVVISFPTSAAKHPGPVLATYAHGALAPFPNAAAQSGMRSPLGMTVDARGRLWMIDEGTVAGQTDPAQPVLFGIDPKTNAIFARIALTAPAIRPDTHVNDVRVDLTHGAQGTAFITDTSLADHSALLAVDLATGHAWRMLDGAPSVSADPGFAIEMDGQMHQYRPGHQTTATGGADGIALSADSRTLYWSALSSRRLYSLPTALAADPKTTPEQLAHAVTDCGEIGVADGIITAPDGSLFMTDVERHGVLKRDPDGTLHMVAHDPRFIWPDSLALDGTSLLLTVGQWSRLAAFHDGHDLQERPYLVVKIAPLP